MSLDALKQKLSTLNEFLDKAQTDSGLFKIQRELNRYLKELNEFRSDNFIITELKRLMLDVERIISGPKIPEHPAFNFSWDLRRDAMEISIALQRFWLSYQKEVESRKL